MNASQGFIPIDFTEYESEQKDKSSFTPIDFSEYHSPSFVQRLKNIGKDVAQQFVKGGSQGLLGTYGDILDIAGIQSKRTLPGEEALYKVESEATPEQLIGMQEDDVLPRYSRLPSSNDIGSLLSGLGVPEEGKTTAGRYAHRFGQFLGSGASVGIPALKSSAISSTVGQTLEETGAPKWLQATGEILSLLKTGKVKKGSSVNSVELKNEMENLKNLGFSDQDITLAINGLEKKGILKKFSKQTGKSEKTFQESISNVSDKFNQQLAKSFPGLEKGLPKMREAASELFDGVKQRSEGLVINDPSIFIKKAEQAIDRLHRTLANTPQEKQVIDLLEKAINSAAGRSPADYYIDFYQGLNEIGNWKNPKQREYVFSVIKDAIKDTFNSQGKKGKQLASDFEEANHAWKRFRTAEDISEMLGKGMGEDGINFSKMKKILDDPNKINFLTKGIGKEQSSNLKKISEVGSNIENLKKQITGGQAKQYLETAKRIELLGSIATMNPHIIIPSIGVALGHNAIARLATKLLTDPKYQGLSIKALEAIKENKWLAAKRIVDAYENKLKKDEILD